MNKPLGTQHFSETQLYLEILFVSAVVTILVVRFFLRLTNYPQLGGAGLHVAHMLWGGLLMLAALLTLFLFELKPFKQLAALSGGIGFGLFIDELGKFITSDNNYFFEPTVALIYIIFVILFLVSRWLAKFSHRTVSSLGVTFETTVGKRVNFLTRFSSWFHQWYSRLLAQPWFSLGVIIFFVAYSFFHLYKSADILSLYFRLNEFSLNYIEIGQFLSALLSALVVIVGIVALRSSRILSFRLFKDAVYVSILLTQFFNFYNNQFEALVVLVFNLLVLIVLQYTLEHEIYEAKIANRR